MNLHVRRFLCAIGDDAIRVNAEDDNWGPNFATTQGGGIPPTPGGQQVMPGQGLVIPPVTNQTLWSWAYKLVSNSPMMENVVGLYAHDTFYRMFNFVFEIEHWCPNRRC